ncbi:MAG: hypothetical protein ACI9DC_001167 [Gammaproteobacteria bacterium]|jgi:hypothetical protein
MTAVHVERLGSAPIITPHMDGRMGDNINGPSLILVPDWIDNALGRYYLYFAHHDGHYIRMAYADALEGPWQIHEAGVLPLAESHFAGHIASPDVHVDHAQQCIRMYYHGGEFPTHHPGPQWSRVALSTDGLHFDAREEHLARPYLRMVGHDSGHLGLAMPGHFYRSTDGISSFETGPVLFNENMRHTAIMIRNDRLLVFYTEVGDTPEHIKLSEIALQGDWQHWSASEPVIVLAPERDYEGANRPRQASVRGLSPEAVNEVRDPALYEEDGTLYLLYSVAGEGGIALARIDLG